MNFLDHTLPDASASYLNALAQLTIKQVEQNYLLQNNQMQIETILNRVTALEDHVGIAKRDLHIVANNYQTMQSLVQDGLELVVIPAGSFIMGSNDFKNEKPHHTVNVRSFAMGKTPVTQHQWQAVMGSNPSYFKEGGGDCPVEMVSWYDVEQFIQKLNIKTGKTYRLPSEAEWEYAARAGATGNWCFGNDESQLGRYAWYKANSGDRTHPVAQKQANAFGLFDMHGNVWEWIQDNHHDNYDGTPTDGSAWTRVDVQSPHVRRGGSKNNEPVNMRSAERDQSHPDERYNNIGFRLARTLLT